ncbi:glutaredoxin family protein [Motilimonas sp. 1_MG-2023]|uniref:glutaredoxin family protein n=1 Tax=Motilimonas TaxID=1914248 RepID=UPI0026E493D1|nr:glutaredoxin family protein [Motilimonas sp. 1_MG-2023]MDO6527905.1 glutaredoxin family protein [Motilimonas sp. 1_MG-2023]
MLGVTLYSADGCHLCELAKAILDDLAVTYSVIDIALDDELVERFGVRIPVLMKDSSDNDLGWPFDAAAVTLFLE